MRVKVAHQGAAAQKRRFVALPLFFGKAHHLQAKGQALACGVQLLHAGHGHQNAQPPVVFAAVAHRVVVRAGKQPRRIGRLPVVNAHHVAHGVVVHVVKATGAHPLRQLRGHRAVRWGEVGGGQFPALGKALVAVLGQVFGPIPHLVAVLRVQAKFVV